MSEEHTQSPADAGTAEFPQDVQQPVVQPDAQQPTNQPVVEKPADPAATETADKPAHEPAEKPVDLPADKPAEKAADPAAAKPADKPAGKPADLPVDKPADKPADKPVAKPVDKPANPTTSKPGGRPGGKPGGKPGGAAGRAPVVPTATSQSVAPIVENIAPPSDPRQWGRISEDGTVYVGTGADEREIGSWQAGDDDAGLAHFGRRFDDFMTEVALLESRIASGSGDAKATHKQAVALRDSLADLAGIGDFASAASRLDAAVVDAQAGIEKAAASRAQARADAIAAKEKLCAEAEKLAKSTQWKATGDRLRVIVDEWRAIHGIDRKTDDGLWKRFARARDEFTRARGSHFAELDKQRLVAKDVKEKLIKQAEGFSNSRDWSETTTAYRGLMAEWKAAGRAPRDVEDSLWERFRAAQEAFFERRNEVFAERDAEYAANAVVKEQLLVEAEQIDPAKDLDAAKNSLRSIQDRWDAAGKVPRDRIRALDGRLRKVEETVRAASDAEWQRSDPEAEARLQQFASRVEQFREQAKKARAAGNERKAKEADDQAATWEKWLEAARGAVS